MPPADRRPGPHGRGEERAGAPALAAEDHHGEVEAQGDGGGELGVGDVLVWVGDHEGPGAGAGHACGEPERGGVPGEEPRGRLDGRACGEALPPPLGWDRAGRGHHQVGIGEVGHGGPVAGGHPLGAPGPGQSPAETLEQDGGVADGPPLAARPSRAVGGQPEPVGARRDLDHGATLPVAGGLQRGASLGGKGLARGRAGHNQARARPGDQLGGHADAARPACAGVCRGGSGEVRGRRNQEVGGHGDVGRRAGCPGQVGDRCGPAPLLDVEHLRTPGGHGEKSGGIGGLEAAGLPLAQWGEAGDGHEGDAAGGRRPHPWEEVGRPRAVGAKAQAQLAR